MGTTSETIKAKLADSASLESFLKRTIISSSTTREEFENMVNFLANKGWTRKDLYELALFINRNEQLHEEEHDRVASFIDGLTGFVAYPYIFRLPGDPDDQEAFLTYVFSEEWKA